MILEISGVKRAVMEPVQNILRKDCELMSIHPMCGRESKGIEYANPAIFDQANFILIPDDRNSASTIVKDSSLAKDLGCKNISVLTPEEHDKMIGFLSQLTHVIAVTLMDTHENEHLVEYTGDSFRDLTRIASINEDMWCELFLLNKDILLDEFRDLTRIASINEDMWCELFLLNKDILLDEIRQFRDTLDEFTQALEQSNEQKMKDMMVLSTKRRHKFD